MIRSLTLSVLGAMMVCGAQAQLTVPVPPATPKSPEFVPPPKVETPPPAPVEPPITPPDLVKRDDKGKVIELNEPVEFAAIKALNLPADRNAKIASAMSDRSAKVERQVIKNIDMALTLRKAMPGLNQIKDLTGVVSLQKPNAAMIYRPGAIDDLLAAGAIKNNEAEAARKAVQGYQSAITEQLKAMAGTDQMAVVIPASQFTIRSQSLECRNALEALLAKAASKQGTSPDALAEKLAGMSAEEAGKVLEPFAAPLPAAPASAPAGK